MYMSNEQVMDIFFKILDMYGSNRYRQEDIAKKLNVPLKAVSFCTKQAGYWHTKAKQGVKPVYYKNDPTFDEFESLLKI